MIKIPQNLEIKIEKLSNSLLDRQKSIKKGLVYFLICSSLALTSCSTYVGYSIAEDIEVLEVKYEPSTQKDSEDLQKDKENFYRE